MLGADSCLFFFAQCANSGTLGFAGLALGFLGLGNLVAFPLFLASLLLDCGTLACLLAFALLDRYLALKVPTSFFGEFLFCNPLSFGEFLAGNSLALTLECDTLLLPLALADGISRLRIEGGTHMPWSPSFHYLVDAWLPTLRRT
ncbi:MAG: RNA 3'-terminal phosphate cyclase, partial [Ilumatobacteraceae bacterium]